MLTKRKRSKAKWDECGKKKKKKKGKRKNNERKKKNQNSLEPTLLLESSRTLSI